MFAHMTRRSLLAGSAGVALFGSARPSAAQALPTISAPETYEVVLFGDGKRTTFARYRGARAI